MPLGVEVTAPLPVPAMATVSVLVLVVASHVTAMVRDADIGTTHAPAPLHGLPTPVTVEPLAAATVSVTLVPAAKLALQVAPQLIPLGDDAALARGAWRLRMRDGQEPHGLFTLLLRRLEGGWRIVHDHTSPGE